MRPRSRLLLVAVLAVGMAAFCSWCRRSHGRCRRERRPSGAAGVESGRGQIFSCCAGLALGVLIAWSVCGVVAAAEPAALSLTVQVQDDGTVLVTGTVTDSKGNPLSGVPVTFQVKTTFGWLPVDEVNTRRDGEVTVVLPQVPRSGEIAAEAGDGEKTVHAAKWIDAPPPPVPATRPGPDVLSRLSLQPGFISPYPVPLEVAILALVLGGVWVTYAYLVSLLVRIRRAPVRWRPH